MLRRRIVLYITDTEAYLNRSAIAALKSVSTVLPKDVTVSTHVVNSDKSKQRYLPSIAFKIGNKTICSLRGYITDANLIDTLKSLE